MTNEIYEVFLNRPDNVTVEEMEKYITEAICLYPNKDKRFDLRLPVNVRKA